jgi:hypothetical protein
LKKLISRRRPPQRKEVKRIMSISEKEIGTLSMPSGDTA